MGKVNNVFTNYFRNRTRFSDLYNGICFQGKSVVLPELLTDASEVYNEADAEKTEHTSGYTQVKRGRQLNQLRRKNRENKNWDSWAEEACGIKKTDRLTPIYTLCVYHGLEKWDGPRNLRDMMDFGKDTEGISSLFHDYPMRLCCLNEMEDFQVFHTEIRQVFQIMQFRKDKKKLQELINTDMAYRHMDADTLEVISVMLNAPKIWENREKHMCEDGEREDYDMCQALKEWIEDERDAGMQDGIEKGIEALIEICKELSLSREETSKK